MPTDDFTHSEESVSFELPFMDAVSNIGIGLPNFHFHIIVKQLCLNLMGP